jgi:hypothetical protein
MSDKYTANSRPDRLQFGAKSAGRRRVYGDVEKQSDCRGRMVGMYRGLFVTAGFYVVAW